MSAARRSRPTRSGGRRLADWLKRLSLEASTHLGPRFLVRAGDFEKAPHEVFDRMAAKLDAMERGDPPSDD